MRPALSGAMRCSEMHCELTFARPNDCRSFQKIMAHTGFLGVSVLVGERWEQQGYIWGASPEIGKRQVFSVDLSRVVGDLLRLASGM